MYYKKFLKLDSIINISDLIISDIENDRKVSYFDIMNLNSLLSFKESLKMNKSYHKNDLLSLKYELIRIRNDSINSLKLFMKR